MFSDDYVDMNNVVKSWEDKVRILENNYKALNESYSKQFIKLKALEEQNILLLRQIDSLQKALIELGVDPR